MRKPNYSMERKDRERAKQAKAAAKVEKRAAKSAESRRPDTFATGEHIDARNAERVKPQG